MNKIILYLLMGIASFFSAFAVGLNRYAVSINSTQKPLKNLKMLIISEILMHGISGFFIGLILSEYINTVPFLIATAGGGGMAGKKLFLTIFEGITMGFIKLTEKHDDEEEQ